MSLVPDPYTQRQPPLRDSGSALGSAPKYSIIIVMKLAVLVQQYITSSIITNSIRPFQTLIEAN
jgi:hypothetical protein